MTDVYLEKLWLRGFRSYKSEREITFSPSPGLTVIVGPNGIGKSTIFDAIEWGLTGELRRLNATEGRAPEKKAALGKAPEVQMWFSDMAHIHRKPKKEIINNTDFVSIKDWLTTEKWRGVSNIADCLQLTHFLGQSSRQMFVHLDGKQRWGLLEGPAGLQSLWKVQSTLGRKQTESGFNRVGEMFQREESRLLEDLSRIQSIRENLRSQQELERADERLAPAEVISRCRSISEDLENRLQTIPEESSSPPALADIDSILQNQRVTLEAAENQLAGRRAQLTEWRELAQAYSITLAKLASLRQEKDRTAHEYGMARNAAEAGEAETTRVTANHQSLVDQNLAQHAVRDSIVAEIGRNQKIITVGERLRELIRNSTELAAKRDDQAKQLDAKKATLETIELNYSRHAELVERSVALKALLVQAEALIPKDIIRQASRLELVSLPASEAELRASIDKQRQEIERLSADANKLKLQRDSSITVSNAISAGVAQIASALSAEDCVCPVCKTNFTLTGRLKELATQRANETNRRLVDIEKDLSQQIGKIQAAQQEIFDLEGRAVRLQERKESLQKTILLTDQLENALRKSPLLSGLDIKAFLPKATEALDQNHQEIKDLVTTLTSQPDVISVRSEIQRLIDLWQVTLSEYEKTLDTQLGLKFELEQLRSGPASGKTVEQLQASATDSQISLQKLSHGLSESRAIIDATKVNETALKARSAEKLNLLKEVDAKLTVLQQSRQDLEDRWSRQGFSDLPTPANVQQIDELHTSQSVRLLRISQEHSAILNGYRRYLAHTDLQRLEATLVEECIKHEAADIVGVIGKLNIELTALKKKQSLLAAVQQKRFELLSVLTQKASDIREAVSTPLNANTERFCAALMSDRGHTVSLNAIANATTAQALLSFQPEGEDASKDPLLYMSEGQLAATSLCLLFGASATYPWSRWKALLMDDPLHHNDSIHAAAFIDVVRNLIRSQGYQIIVSTHDMEQAGYFLRKCRNAGIDARYLHLYGRAEDGTALVQNA